MAEKLPVIIDNRGTEGLLSAVRRLPLSRLAHSKPVLSLHS